MVSAVFVKIAACWFLLMVVRAACGFCRLLKQMPVEFAAEKYQLLVVTADCGFCGLWYKLLMDGTILVVISLFV